MKRRIGDRREGIESAHNVKKRKVIRKGRRGKESTNEDRHLRSEKRGGRE